MADPAGAEKIDISVEIDAAPNAIRSGPDGTDPGPSRNLRIRLAICRSLCDVLQTSWRYPLGLPPPLVAQSLRVADVGSA